MRISTWMMTVAAMLAFGFVGSARADDPVEPVHPAQQRLMEANERVRTLLAENPESPEIGEIINGLLDYEGLSSRSLEARWTQVTQAQRDEFLAVFRARVDQEYKGSLKSALDNYAVDYLGSEEASDGLSVFVRTLVRKLNTRRGRRAEITVTYEMRRVAGVWKVVDIINDDVPLTQSYRDQFNRIFGRFDTLEAGWNDLVSRLREPLESD